MSMLRFWTSCVHRHVHLQLTGCRWKACDTPFCKVLQQIRSQYVCTQGVLQKWGCQFQDIGTDKKIKLLHSMNTGGAPSVWRHVWKQGVVPLFTRLLSDSLYALVLRLAFSCTLPVLQYRRHQLRLLLRFGPYLLRTLYIMIMIEDLLGLFCLNPVFDYE